MKAGMKHTDIGWLPEDWDASQLIKCTSQFKSGFSITSREITDDTSGYPVYGGNGLRGYSNKYTHESELVLIGRQGALCGNLNYIQGKNYVSEHAIAVRANSSTTTSYLHYALDRLNLNSLSESSAQPGLSVEKIIKLAIPVPPVPEQQAIAEALRDADAWIECMEALRHKKRLIKKGAMQELLSPKEGWREKSLTGMVNNLRALFNDGDWVEAEHITSSGIRLVQTGNIGIGVFHDKDAKKYISENSFNVLKCKEVLPGDILICRLAEPAGRACVMPSLDEIKVITSVDVTIFSPDQKDFNRNFIMYSLSTEKWFDAVNENVGGTTHKRISRSNLGRIQISVPEFDEQTRIATILSDMDAEIETLEQKLTKARQTKQGMMQQLLTGQIRLVKPTSAKAVKTSKRATA